MTDVLRARGSRVSSARREGCPVANHSDGVTLFAKLYRGLATTTVLTMLLLSILLPGCDSRLREEKRGLKAVYSPGQNGWVVSFRGEGKAKPENIRVRVGNSTEFELKGGLLELPSKPVELRVRFAIGGVEQEPLVIHFDPKKAALSNGKANLEMLRGKWVGWRETGERDLVYFTTLNSYSCVLSKVEFGFGGVPDREWELPPCRGYPSPRSPPTDRTVLEAPEGAVSIALRLTFGDGERTEVEHVASDNSGGAVAWKSMGCKGGRWSYVVRKWDMGSDGSETKKGTVAATSSQDALEEVFAKEGIRGNKDMATTTRRRGEWRGYGPSKQVSVVVEPECLLSRERSGDPAPAEAQAADDASSDRPRGAEP